MLIGLVISNITKNGRYIRKNFNNPKYIYECLNNISKYNKSMLAPFALTGYNAKYNFNLLKILILELRDKGLITLDKDNIIITNINAYKFKATEVSLAKSLVGIITEFYNTDSPKLNNIMNLTSTYTEELKQSIKNRLPRKEYKKLVKQAKFIEWYAHSIYVNSIISMSYLMNNDISKEELTLMTFNYTNCYQPDTINDWADALDISLWLECKNYMILNNINSDSHKQISSSSGCSSCSSCSSCGGCGGAD